MIIITLYLTIPAAFFEVAAADKAYSSTFLIAYVTVCKETYWVYLQMIS